MPRSGHQLEQCLERPTWTRQSTQSLPGCRDLGAVIMVLCAHVAPRKVSSLPRGHTARADRLHQTAHMGGAAAFSNEISNLPLERWRRESRTCRSRAICCPDLTSGPVLPKRGALAKLRYSPY